MSTFIADNTNKQTKYSEKQQQNVQIVSIKSLGDKKKKSYRPQICALSQSIRLEIVIVRYVIKMYVCNRHQMGNMQWSSS